MRVNTNLIFNFFFLKIPTCLDLDDPIVQQEISRVRQIRKQIDSRSPSMKRKCDSTDKENFSNQFERQSLAKKPNDSTTPNTPTTSKSNGIISSTLIKNILFLNILKNRL